MQQHKIIGRKKNSNMIWERRKLEAIIIKMRVLRSGVIIFINSVHKKESVQLFTFKVVTKKLQLANFGWWGSD